MENQYIKQFPDLMQGKKIMYVHGFLSSGQSGTVKMLQELMPNATLVGNTMSSMTGRQEFQNPRKDGVQELMVNKGLIKEYKDITTLCFQNVTPEEQERVYGLFGDKDPVVHTFDLFHQHYPKAIRFHGEHRLIDKVAFHYLAPVIRWIDDKQNGKERPIVYIAFDALHDSYMKATSSMHKAYEMLIEYYQVYIVAPSPSNDHAYMAQVLAWVEEYLSAPAYNHVIFCNQKSQLYGDYFIDPCPDPDFMGTTIEYGSDEFKTFEEIITFFERLGGQ